MGTFVGVSDVISAADVVLSLPLLSGITSVLHKSAHCDTHSTAAGWPSACAHGPPVHPVPQEATALSAGK